jgi:hypothetical protein
MLVGRKPARPIAASIAAGVTGDSARGRRRGRGLLGYRACSAGRGSRGAESEDRDQLDDASRRCDLARDPTRHRTAARTLLVEDRAHRRGIGAGAQVDGDVDLAAEPGRAWVHAETRLREAASS